MLILLAAIMMAGCDKEKNVEPTLEKVNPASITAVAGGETVKVTLESNTTWSAAITSGEETGWVTIRDGSGEGNGEFSVDIAALEGFGEGRDTSIDIVAGTGDNAKKYTLNINQAGVAATLSVDPSEKSFDSASNSLTVAVTSNGKWTAEVADASGNPWCTLENHAGTGNGAFVINVGDNNDAGTRDVTVKVKMEDAEKEATVAISQTGRTFSEDSILVSPLTMDNEYEVTLEGAWTASSEDTWIDVTAKSGQGAGTLKFKSTANAEDITASRKGTIVVASGMETLTITVTQVPMAVFVKYTVNGVDYELYWSTLLVGEFRKFMTMPDERGYFYQFNRKVAYSPFDPCTPEFSLDPIKEEKTDWQPENDPCPEGWKMPNRMEGVALQTQACTVVEVAQGERGSRAAGYFVSRDGNIEEATIDDMKGCIFFPMTMIRNAKDGALTLPSTTFVADTESSTFWTSSDWHQSLLPGQMGYSVTYGHSKNYGLLAFETQFSKNNGANVRCIKVME